MGDRLRTALKWLGLALLVLGPVWAVVAMTAAFAVGGPPGSVAEFGASLDVLFRYLVPTVVAGGTLWLLARIDERLEARG